MENKKIEELQNEIEDLKNKRKIIIDKRDKIVEEFKQSEKYKTLEGERRKLYEKMNDIDGEISKIDKEINNLFLIDVSSGYNRPSWSTTCGKNIRPKIITAIKQTFDFNKLSGSSIENIVLKMMGYEKMIHERRKKLSEERNDVTQEENIKQHKVWDLKNELTDESQKEIQELSNQIMVKEEELVQLKLFKGKGIKKGELNNPHLKKRALEEYRQECESNFGKVLKKLIELGGKDE